MERMNSQYLFISPFGGQYREIEEAIAQTLLEIGVEPILAEKMAPKGSIAEAIQRLIEQADFIIADLTGYNPNVMYEIGFALGLRKPLLLIVQHGSKRLPSDMSGHLFLVYDPSHLGELQQNIREWVLRHLARRKELTI